MAKAARSGEVICGHCGQSTPKLEYCCRCGFPLTVEAGAAGGRHRRKFAAAPDEPAWAVRLTSTLFPQLPAHDMVAFRIALLSGLGLILALGIAGVFPVGLAAAAVLVPLLMLLYLYDADIYEDEPLRVVGLTMLWGVVVGVGIGIGLENISVSVQEHGWAHLGDGDVLLRVFAVPAATALLALVGPLMLLRYPRFNDVLDGVIFGAASAVALQASLMLFAAWPLTEAGLRPDQDTLAWTVRLVELGVLVPVIAAGAVGWAAASFWLAFRAPVRDGRALGALGVPITAVPVAIVLLVLAALAQQILGAVGRTVALLALAAIALLLLRRAIHVGLLEEADEADPEADVTCANCGRRTPVHSFCGRCGIALRALPKQRPSARGARR